MTPRQIAGWLYIARRRRQREAAEQLALERSPLAVNHAR